jgi:chitinase
MLVTLFALAAIAGVAPLFSGANFAVQTLNPQTASAAADFVAPTVDRSVIADTVSGTPFDGAGFVAQGGTYRVYANVTDAGTISSVTADVTSVSDGGHAAVPLVAGSHTVGGVTYNYASAEQTASTPLSEGSKSYTVTATDSAANSSSPASFSVTVDNTAPTVGTSTIARTDGVAPGFIRQGDSYFVYANASDSSSGIHDVTANVANVTSGQTAAALTTTGGPWTVNGVSYAYRSASLTAGASLTDGSKAYTVTARDNATNSSSPSNFSVTADSTAPAISGSAIATTAAGDPIDGPGVIRAAGTYRVYAEVSDTGIGVASVRADVSSATTGQTAATLTFNSTGVTVGGITYHWISSELTADSGLTAGTKSYSISAADTLTNSGSQSFNVTADNTAPTVSLTSPVSATTISGTITPAATATDANGVAFVTIQRSPAGTGTWTDVCKVTASPYSCSFDTTTVADGLYDFRAVATDRGGNTANSTAATNVRISNSTAPVAVKFDAQNCVPASSACVAGRPDQNDVLTFTYSKGMKASSVIPGWDGTSARNVRVNLTDSGSADTVTEVQLDTGSGTVSLGTIQLGANYVNGGNIAFLSSPISQSADKTTFTITLGTLCQTSVSPTFCGTGSPQKVNSAKTVTWDPTATPPATDLSGLAVDPTVKPPRDFIAF